VVGASIGMAGTGSSMAWEDRDALLRSADVAMYAAKGVGKACYRLFEPSMLSSIVERHDLAAELRNGVGGDEFELYYQPLVALGTGGLAGLEALVRWHHPRHGLLGPVDFIPVAEDSGAILALGQWVLAQSCLQASRWLGAYPTLGDWTMSVNVSVRQLQQSGFLTGLRGALDGADLDPRHLLLEVTESVMAHDSTVMLERLREVQELGVRIGLDDFATGYSSLAHLREMPVDMLKIDRCFVADIGAVPPDRELVPVILDLGRTLGIQVVAEGIERQDQLDRLKSLGCELGQGYLLGRPLPAGETARVLAEASSHRFRPAA
jgi:EAL domain-containing protein (putative c-di-GMP-specific phosphodiesterase class I)